MLECGCECDFDIFDSDIPWYQEPDDYSTLSTSRRKRCQSCNRLIDIGTIVGEFARFRWPRTEVELKIYGETQEPDSIIGIASHYLCEECMDIYYNLSALGFCISLYENQPSLLKEYINNRSNHGKQL